jgi:hypothetical protein
MPDAAFPNVANKEHLLAWAQRCQQTQDLPKFRGQQQRRMLIANKLRA